MPRPHALFLLACLAALTGCQNPWKDFYQGADLPPDAPRNGTPVLIAVTNFDSSVRDYVREGYHPFGSSAFNAGMNVSLGDLQKFGESIGADVILYAVGNRTQVQTSQVIPQYHPGTQQNTYLSGYSSTGQSFYGTATSYSSGTYSTAVVPVTIVRQDYGAVYLKRRWTKPILGVDVRPCTPEESRRIDTNSALTIEIVMRGSPAFLADIYEGDCILEFDGAKPPANGDAFYELLSKYEGRTVKIVLARNGTRVTKTVRLGTSR